VWLLDKIEKQIRLFKNKIGLVYSGVQYIDALGNNIGIEQCDQEIRGSVYEKLIVKNRMTGGTVIVKNEALERVGLFDEKFAAAENWDLWIRVTQYYEVDFVDEALLKYRKHSDNMSSNNTLMLDATYSILEKYCLNANIDSNACEVATANYHYRVGIYLTSIGDYLNARANFKKANKYVPNYLDCDIRILRSYLGKGLNEFISAWIQKIKPILGRRKKPGEVW
jgi:tetratricopeptide (TPR) repeat protein